MRSEQRHRAEDGALMFSAWTPEMVEAMRRGFGWYAANPELRNLAESERCVNFGADECTGRALESGWCEGCSALLFSKEMT